MYKMRGIVERGLGKVARRSCDARARSFGCCFGMIPILGMPIASWASGRTPGRPQNSRREDMLRAMRNRCSLKCVIYIHEDLNDCDCIEPEYYITTIALEGSKLFCLDKWYSSMYRFLRLLDIHTCTLNQNDLENETT